MTAIGNGNAQGEGTDQVSNVPASGTKSSKSSKSLSAAAMTAASNGASDRRADTRTGKRQRQGLPLHIVVPVLVGMASLTIFAMDWRTVQVERDAWSTGETAVYNKDVTLRAQSGPAEILSEAIGIAICRGAQFKQRPMTAFVGRSASLRLTVQDVGPERVGAILTHLATAVREGQPSTWPGVTWSTVPQEAAGAIERTIALVEAGAFTPPDAVGARFLPAHWEPTPNALETRTVGDGFTAEWVWSLGSVADEGTREPELPVDLAFQFALEGKTYDSRQQVAATMETATLASDTIDGLFARLSQVQLLVVGLILPLVSFVWARKSKKA